MAKTDSKRAPHERYLRREYCPIRAGNIDGETWLIHFPQQNPWISSHLGSSEYIHDGAIVRALNSTYKPNRNLPSRPSHTVFVRISPKTTEETLLRHFSPVTKVISCVVVRDIVTGMSKGYGFLEVESEEEVRKVTKLMNKTFIDDFKIVVQKECGRNLKGWKPRRLGGGFGGNRSSGQLRFGGIARPFEEATYRSDDLPEGSKHKKRWDRFGVSKCYPNLFQSDVCTISQVFCRICRYPLCLNTQMFS